MTIDGEEMMAMAYVVRSPALPEGQAVAAVIYEMRDDLAVGCSFDGETALLLIEGQPVDVPPGSIYVYSSADQSLCQTAHKWGTDEFESISLEPRFERVAEEAARGNMECEEIIYLGSGAR